MVVNVGHAEGFANGQVGGQADGHAQGHGPGGILAPLVGPLSHRIEHELGGPLFQRDPAFIERQLALMARYTSFFSPEVKALDNLPATGPVLVVGNHSCLMYMPDAWVVGLSLIRGGAASISPRTPSPTTCSSACPVWARSCGGSAPSRRGGAGPN